MRKITVTLRLVGLASFLMCGMGCSNAEPVEVSLFEATATATNIVPDCEGVTPTGEFSGRLWLDDGESESDVLLYEMVGLPLGEGLSGTLDVSHVLETVVGAEICVYSTDVEEDDDFSDDNLSSDRACHEIRADEANITFTLTMVRGTCALNISIPATVATR